MVGAPIYPHGHYGAPSSARIKYLITGLVVGLVVGMQVMLIQVNSKGGATGGDAPASAASTALFGDGPELRMERKVQAAVDEIVAAAHQRRPAAGMDGALPAEFPASLPEGALRRDVRVVWCGVV